MGKNRLICEVRRFSGFNEGGSNHPQTVKPMKKDVARNTLRWHQSSSMLLHGSENQKSYHTGRFPLNLESSDPSVSSVYPIRRHQQEMSDIVWTLQNLIQDAKICQCFHVMKLWDFVALWTIAKWPHSFMALSSEVLSTGNARSP
jgi:hypothetical protein